MAYLSRKVSFSSELALAGKSLSLTLQASSDALGCVRTPASSIPKIKNMVIITVFAVDTPIDFRLIHLCLQQLCRKQTKYTLR